MAHILAIHDDAVIRESVRQALTDAGHVVVCVRNGRAGRAVYEVMRPDLAVIAAATTDPDSVKLLEAIPKSANPTPVIALTAGSGPGNKTMQQNVARLLECKAVRTTPLRRHQLCTVVTQALIDRKRGAS